MSAAGNIFSSANITKIIVLVSGDTITEGSVLKSLSGKYPELIPRLTEAVKNKTHKPGDFIKIQNDNGITFFFVVTRLVEKFQGYFIDTLRGLEKVVEILKREVTSSSGGTLGGVLLPLPANDEVKLADSIVIPAVSDLMNIKGIETYVLTNSDYAQYVENISEDGVYYKRDSWKSDWMLTLDDLVIIAVIEKLTVMLHDFNISKSNLVKCYLHCNKNGVFTKLEFYETPFGPFFRMFLVKSNGLIHHGLLMNKHHYSNQEPKKFSCILGPMWPLLKHMAYTKLLEKKDLIQKIANEVKVDYYASFKKPDGNAQPNSFNNQKPAPQAFSI